MREFSEETGGVFKDQLDCIAEKIRSDSCFRLWCGSSKYVLFVTQITYDLELPQKFQHNRLNNQHDFTETDQLQIKCKLTHILQHHTHTARTLHTLAHSLSLSLSISLPLLCSLTHFPMLCYAMLYYTARTHTRTRTHTHTHTERERERERKSREFLKHIICLSLQINVPLLIWTSKGVSHSNLVDSITRRGAHANWMNKGKVLIDDEMCPLHPFFFNMIALPPIKRYLVGLATRGCTTATTTDIATCEQDKMVQEDPVKENKNEQEQGELLHISKECEGQESKEEEEIVVSSNKGSNEYSDGQKICAV